MPFELITSAETAQLLDVDRSTVSRLASSGKLPAVVDSPAFRLFDRAVVERVATQRAKQPRRGRRRKPVGPAAPDAPAEAGQRAGLSSEGAS